MILEFSMDSSVSILLIIFESNSCENKSMPKSFISFFLLSKSECINILISSSSALCNFVLKLKTLFFTAVVSDLL